ncbi:hypothetical protein GQ44DRAFT_833025 [Phaeosphaeriaceae sp. PMI808]|nr:hypothetical protein GQ44DRAFT_833025 [Phaeosphaeriaceae sp. PMI808]
MASEIVVGIDFGTTYSGVSWVVNGGKKLIRVINDWPNPNSAVATSDKVPSKISYENGQPHHWGFEVNFKEDSFRWIKLLLDPESKFGRESEAVLNTHKLLRTLGKTAETVATDLLRLIWTYTKEDISRVRGDDWESSYTLSVVLTVPAIWSPKAKEKTLQIARQAGLPDNLKLVSEPEAAALAVLNEKNDEDASLEIGDRFVVCDAGGGTVDLISYEICGLTPLQIEECAVGDGELCGSVYLDQAFEKYIRTIVGEEWGGIKDKAKKKMMDEFENSIKRCYTGEDNTYSVDLQGVEDNPKEGIDDETIQLQPNTLKTIFDHVIGQIMRLVEKQLDMVQDKGGKVKAILLVGGFGTNRYMHQRLKDAHSNSGIVVLQNTQGWSSICRGATMWGLENSTYSPPPKKTVRARIARYSYGLCYETEFDASKGHERRDREWSPRGYWEARNQMRWLLEKGRIFERSDRGIRKFSEALYYCSDDDPPNRKEISVKELCKVNYGIKSSKLWLQEDSYKDPRHGKKWRDVPFDLQIELGSANLHFSVLYREEPVAYTEAKYKEEF